MVNLCKIEIDGVEFFNNHNLKKFSTMQLESTGNLFIVNSISALSKLVNILTKDKIEYTVLGMGANTLIPRQSHKPFIKLSFDFDKNYLNKYRDEYALPASVSLSALSSHASKFGVKGWQAFTGIPATLGGAICMNAGTALGEICEVVKEVMVMTRLGTIKKICIDSKSFSYRTNNFLEQGDIIISATLKSLGQDDSLSTVIRDYLKLRNSSQPLKESSCGCSFKNFKMQTNNSLETCRVGQYIDIINMKGFIVNDAQVSHKHANFLINKGSANADDVEEVINIIQDELNLTFGIVFDPEVKISKKIYFN